MSIQTFLTSLPSLLGFAGFIAYLLWQKSRPSSPVVQAIVDIVRSKQQAPVLLDDRLSARQVHRLLQDHPELRSALGANDYSLLGDVLRRESKERFAAVGAVIACCAASVGMYVWGPRPDSIRIESAQLLSAFKPGDSPVNTYDDVEVRWEHYGPAGQIGITATNVYSGVSTKTYTIQAADHRLRIPASDLKALWPDPQLTDRFDVRIAIQTSDGVKHFGPFEVKTALEIHYYIYHGEVTVTARTSNRGALNHAFEAKVVAYPAAAKTPETAAPRSLDLKSESGKARASFPVDFPVDEQTMKCVYFGPHPLSLVRYYNGNTDQLR